MQLFIENSDLRRPLRRLLAIAATAMVGCGAPLNSADDVSTLFTDGQTLGDKMTALCGTLAARTQEPSLSGLDFGANECANAGYQSQDLNGMKEIAFSSISSGPTKLTAEDGKDSTFRLQTRVELWLNRNLLKLVRIILPSLRDRSESILGSGNSATGNEGETKFKIKIIDKAVFDKEALTLNMQFELVSKKIDNGLIDVQNRFSLKGELVDKKYIFATVSTVQDQPVDVSLLKRAKVAVFVVPHAKDIYVDIVSDAEFYSFGVDEVMKAQIIKLFAKALKKIPELLSQAESKVQ